MVDTTCHTHTHAHVQHVHMCTYHTSLPCVHGLHMWVCHAWLQLLAQATWKETISPGLNSLPKGICAFKLGTLAKRVPSETNPTAGSLAQRDPFTKPKAFRGVQETPLVQRGWLIGINGMANPSGGIARTGHQELAQWAIPGGRRWDRRPWPEKQLKPLPKGIKTKLQQMQQHQLQQMQQHQLQQMQQHQLQHQAAQKAPPAAAAPAWVWMPRGQKQSLSNLLTKGMRKKMRKKMKKTMWKKKQHLLTKGMRRKQMSRKRAHLLAKGMWQMSHKGLVGQVPGELHQPHHHQSQDPCQKGRDPGSSARTRAWRHLDPEAEQEHQSGSGLVQCDGGGWCGPTQLHCSCANIAAQWLPGVHGVLLWPPQTTWGAPEAEAAAPGVH